MNGTDRIIESLPALIGIEIHFQTDLDADLLSVFFPQRNQFLPVDLRRFGRHAVTLIKSGMTVSGDADFRQPLFDGCKDHLLCGISSVTVRRMHMVILQYHDILLGSDFLFRHLLLLDLVIDHVTGRQFLMDILQ